MRAMILQPRLRGIRCLPVVSAHNISSRPPQRSHSAKDGCRGCGICFLSVIEERGKNRSLPHKKPAVRDDIYEGFGVVKELIAHTSSQHSEEGAISLS